MTKEDIFYCLFSSGQITLTQYLETRGDYVCKMWEELIKASESYKQDS